MAQPIRVLVWDENPAHAPKELYPNGLNGAIAEGLRAFGGSAVQVITQNLDDDDQGASEIALGETDVLIWWGHARHWDVTDATADRVAHHVRERGMGFIALHSAHYSKTLQRILEAPGHLKGGWRESSPPDREEITVCAPRHPIARGVESFTLEPEEMYGAPFDVPPPLTVVFQSYFPAGGEYFPSGLCWTVGQGKAPGFTSGPGSGVGEGYGAGRMFYFRPGHEAYPTFFDARVRRIIYNAVCWCAGGD